jgi:hypothetical protein
VLVVLISVSGVIMVMMLVIVYSISWLVAVTSITIALSKYLSRDTYFYVLILRTWKLEQVVKLVRPPNYVQNKPWPFILKKKKKGKERMT